MDIGFTRYRLLISLKASNSASAGGPTFLPEQFVGYTLSPDCIAHGFITFFPEEDMNKSRSINLDVINSFSIHPDDDARSVVDAERLRRTSEGYPPETLTKGFWVPPEPF